MESRPQSPAIGIDLGTTHSCVGVFINGKVEIIPNEFGQATTPSIVSFTENERKVGFAAKNEQMMNPKNTVFDAKRLIGRNFSDECVQKDKEHWPFQVEKGPNDKPLIAVEYLRERKTFYPQEISSMVLMKMKQIAENYLKMPVTEAVITVPADFNHNQREATRDAAQIAGLRCIQIINEPTAAAVAYSLDKNQPKSQQNILVFDLGGGTFDVTVLDMNGEFLNVKASSGNGHLGGEDFDSLLVDYCIEQFLKKEKGIKASEISEESKQELRIMCEKQKTMLSSVESVSVNVTKFVGHTHLIVEVSRYQFEEICEIKFTQCIEHVIEALKQAKLTKDQIDQIVLVGGSSRIPKIKTMLREFFNNKPLWDTINPDEAVAYGAAVQASILRNQGGDNDECLPERYLTDVIPFTLGIKVVNGDLEPLIQKNQPIPTFHEKPFRTVRDYATEIKIMVYQGDRPKAEDNYLLGEFKLTGITPAKAGQTRVIVSFNVDENALLSVKAYEEGKQSNQGSLEIKNILASLHAEQREKMIEDSKRYFDQDELMRKSREARLELEKYCGNIKDSVKNQNKIQSITEEDKKKIIAIGEEGIEWARYNVHADILDIQKKKNEISRRYNPIRDEINKKPGITIEKKTDDDDMI